MRAIVLAVALALMPVVANAQSEQTITTEPVTPSITDSTAAASPAELAPMPTNMATLDSYRIAAISTGAVVGVIAANLVTGGMATPVMAGGVALMNTGMWLTTASQLAVTAAGAIVGGYAGDFLYSQ